MFVQIQATPNPSTWKFIPGRSVLPDGNAEFRTIEEAKASPLAELIFLLPGVTSVFYGPDFISVTQSQDHRDSISGFIREHFLTGGNLFHQDRHPKVTHSHHSENSENVGIISKIKDLLDTRVRPAVAQDGGDITFHGFRRGIVYLTLRGACSSCPSAAITLKHGIENLLQHYIPEIVEVRAVE